jgi:Fic family protein
MPVFDRNQPYNELPPLPPGDMVENDPEILKKLVVASRALASVNSYVQRLPNPLMLVNTIALQEAKTSTAIENIFTTEDELYKAVSQKVNEASANPATKEVLRYREALWNGYKYLKENEEVSLLLILGIFQEIKDTQAGVRPPQAQVVIKRGASEGRPSEIIYTPPRGEHVLEEFLKNLMDFLNNDAKYPMDPLVKMCIAHYQFEAIHPFQDGNGRTGRVLNLLYLVQKGLLSQPILYLSKYIILHKEDYYYRLGGVTEHGDWKAWILYMLDAVEKTSIITHSLIHEIVLQMEASWQHGKQKIKWYSKEVNEAIFSQPYCRFKTIEDVVGITSRTTLTKYMNELVRIKLLTPKRDGKSMYFVNDDLVRILGG